MPYFLGLPPKTAKNKVLTLKFVFLLIFPNSSWICESVQHTQHLGARLIWISHGLFTWSHPITVQEEAASNHSLLTFYSLHVSNKQLNHPQTLQKTRIYGEFRALIHFTDCVLSIRQKIKWKILQGAIKATFFDMHVKEKTLDSKKPWTAQHPTQKQTLWEQGNDNLFGTTKSLTQEASLTYFPQNGTRVQKKSRMDFSRT